MPTDTQLFQREILEKFTALYPDTEVVKEWRSITNIPGLYSPRIDVAVGPFSDTRGENRRAQYDEMMDRTESFIESLFDFHFANVRQFRVPDELRAEILDRPVYQLVRNFNDNARCLFAVEIEHRVSRKHLLGGAVNASVLGRLGILVGWTEEKVKALVKLQAYWDFLQSVNKNSFATKNLMILSPEQLRAAFENNRNDY